MTVTPFDPLKAKREEISGLMDVLRVVAAHARMTEQKLGEAEAERAAFLKMEAFMRDMLQRERKALLALETEAEGKK